MDLTPFKESLKGKPVLLMGAGVSVVAASEAFQEYGIKADICEDEPERQQKLKSKGYDFLKLEDIDFNQYACLVICRRISLKDLEDHAIVEKARSFGLEIISDYEILVQCYPDKKIIAVSGSNGKSTTVALITHILNQCGYSAVPGGNSMNPTMKMNIGPETDYIVMDASSTQIALSANFRADIAVLLNIVFPERESSKVMQDYISTKERLFAGKGQGIIALSDSFSKKIHKVSKAQDERKILTVSQSVKEKADIFSKDHILVEALDEPFEVGDLRKLKTLTGEHNWQNALCSYAAAKLAGCKSDDVFQAMESFPGLPHRQYLARTINGVAYINDSKARNAEATSKVLSAYKNIFWIVGGQSEGQKLEGLEPYLDNVREAFLIGEVTKEFSKWLKKRGISVHESKTLEVAVQAAHEAAQASRGAPGGGAVVLLSPASRSRDQFSSYKERGDIFVSLVQNLSSRFQMIASL